MASGGARARSGPARDPNALRRDRDSGSDITRLPAAGRTGPAPDWPLARPTKRERALWEMEWKRPQAIKWEQNWQTLEVALYVRSVVAAEKSSAPASLRTLVRQQQEALGISIPGMIRNKWEIVADTSDGDDQEQANRPAAPGRTSARDRFEVIEGGSDGG